MANNHVSFLRALFGENEDGRKRIFRSIKAKADAKRTLTERTADLMTAKFGSSAFLLFNAVVFTVWILVNTGLIKLLTLLLERQGIDISQDPELHKMLRPVSEEEIEKRLEKEIL